LNKIDKNWDLFEHKTKIRTCFKKLDENWDQKGILTLRILSSLPPAKRNKIKNNQLNNIT